MRKVLFLMFLLLLMGLGAAGVKAQVRIGGNTAPSKAAVLDLNATDATNTGTGGLVLPRVNLTSNTMQLTTGVANVTGTMVYDVTATLGMIGVYCWNGNNWVLASLPSTSRGDSGFVLMSTGSGASWIPLAVPGIGSVGTLSMVATPPTVTWTKIVDAQFTTTQLLNGSEWGYISVPGLLPSDVCFPTVAKGCPFLETWYDAIDLHLTLWQTVPIGTTFGIRCYRPSV